MLPSNVALLIVSSVPPPELFRVPPCTVALTSSTVLAPETVMFAPALSTVMPLMTNTPPAVASSRSVLVTPPEPLSVSVLVPPSGVASITCWLISVRLPLPMTPVPTIVSFVLVRVSLLPSR